VINAGAASHTQVKTAVFGKVTQFNGLRWPIAALAPRQTKLHEEADAAHIRGGARIGGFALNARSSPA